MDKVKLGHNAFTYPMPMTLVGAVVDGKPNFMAVGWVSRVNARPPMIAVALGSHHTNAGIHEHGEFSVNIPDIELLKAVDYCGLVSGKRQDKSGVFELFYGDLAHAPMIQACPLTMECRLVQAVQLPTNTVFIGEIVEAFIGEQYLTDGKPDIQKLRPFTLTMPDNRYWAVGDQVGRAWGSGRDFTT
ncbi:MAG: flavin reductase family protein [Chloroflexi bacterium]|nr:flavin reductase family protein [Chloroflexota bacterium]MBU1747331.1 flavin reductase family protein [Chloroflexota bacterium]MBU1878694.1 flavin reductase family protein [Chloroflexota bacterium]